jgi:YidC/Oxa1 family membrane protein insertase
MAMRTKGQPQNAQMQQMQTILKVMPLIFAFVAFSMQAGLVLYFVVSNLWTIGQQAVIFKQLGPLTPDTSVIEASGREKDTAPKVEKAPKPLPTGKGYTPPRSTLAPSDTSDTKGSTQKKPTPGGKAPARPSGAATGSGAKAAPKAGARAKPAYTAPRPGQGQRNKKKGK